MDDEKFEISYDTVGLVAVVLLIICVMILLGAALTATVTADNMCRAIGYDQGLTNGHLFGTEVTCYMDHDAPMPLEDLMWPENNKGE